MDKNAADFKEVNSDPRVTCFEEIMSSLEKGLCCGPIYSLKAVWTSREQVEREDSAVSSR
jgi:hypothetical protein